MAQTIPPAVAKLLAEKRLGHPRFSFCLACAAARDDGRLTKSNTPGGWPASRYCGASLGLGGTRLAGEESKLDTSAWRHRTHGMQGRGLG